MPKTRSTNLLQRGLNILEVFSRKNRLRFQQIVEETVLPKSTVSRILKTLGALKYINFDNENKMYSLGPKVLSLGHYYLLSVDIRRVALPYLEELSRRTDQNVNLGILDEDRVVYIDSIIRTRIINVEFHVGMRLNSWQTSVGGAILACLSREKLRPLMEGFLKDPKAREYIGPRGERLLKTLKEIRQKGYSLDDEQLVPGLRTAGAPILGAKGAPLGGISILVLAQIVSRERLIKEFVPPLLETAAQVSSALGWEHRRGIRPPSLSSPSRAAISRAM